MPIIMFSNLKGGVAKTTNAVAVAECLALRGYKTLLIDADHQCACSELMLGESELLRLERRGYTLHDLLRDMLKEDFNATAFDYFPVPGVSNIGDGIETLSVIPSSIKIDEFGRTRLDIRDDFTLKDEFKIVEERNRSRFGRWLRSTFEYVIIDSPPSIPDQVRTVFHVSDAYIIPCVPDRLSVRGASWLMERFHRMGFKKHCLGLLWSLYREQDRFHAEMATNVEKRKRPYDKLPRPFSTRIKLTADIAHAITEQKRYRSFADKYKANPAKLYKSLCDEIEKRCRAFGLT